MTPFSECRRPRCGERKVGRENKASRVVKEGVCKPKVAGTLRLPSAKTLGCFAFRLRHTEYAYYFAACTSYLEKRA